MWELDHKGGWAPKNWCFQLWCWRRLLRVLWNVRLPNQSVLKEINPEYSLEGLRLKLKFQYFAAWWEEPTHWKRPWLWERLRAGREEGDRGWDGWMASLTQWKWVWANPRRWWRTGKPGMLQSKGLQKVRRDLAIEQQQQSLFSCARSWWSVNLVDHRIFRDFCFKHRFPGLTMGQNKAILDWSLGTDILKQYYQIIPIINFLSPVGSFLPTLRYCDAVIYSCHSPAKNHNDNNNWHCEALARYQVQS